MPCLASRRSTSKTPCSSSSTVIANSRLPLGATHFFQQCAAFSERVAILAVKRRLLLLEYWIGGTKECFAPLRSERLNGVHLQQGTKGVDLFLYALLLFSPQLLAAKDVEHPTQTLLAFLRNGPQVTAAKVVLLASAQSKASLPNCLNNSVSNIVRRFSPAIRSVSSRAL